MARVGLARPGASHVIPPGVQSLARAVGEPRQSARAPTNRVWHELLAAARTDAELRRRLKPATRKYIENVRELFKHFPGIDAIPDKHVDLWLALLLHLFDGEAIFAVVAPNPHAEDRLLQFVTALALADTPNR